MPEKNKPYIFIDSNIYEGENWYKIKGIIENLSKTYQIVIPLVQIKEIHGHLFNKIKSYSAPDIVQTLHKNIEESPIFEEFKKESEDLYTKYKDLQNKINTKRETLKNEILQIIHDNCEILHSNFEAFKGGKQRTKLDIPPYTTKPEADLFRHYDSLFWETLLYSLPKKSDIFIYSRDGGFIKNNELREFLQNEWKIVNGGTAKLYISNKSDDDIDNKESLTPINNDPKDPPSIPIGSDISFLTDPYKLQKLQAILSENKSFSQESSNSIRNNIRHYMNVCKNELSMNSFISSDNLDKLHRAITKADREFMLPYDEIKDYQNQFKQLDEHRNYF